MGQFERLQKNGIYHRLQIEMTYNSHHIEGSQLSQEQFKKVLDYFRIPYQE